MDSFIDTVSHVDSDATVAASAVAAPKRRGRASKVAPPAMSMILPALAGRRASAGHSERMPLRMVVSSDTADGFSLVVGNYSGSVAIDYQGPSDRTFPQLLAAHKGTVAADGASILQFTGGRGGAYSVAEIVDALTWLSLAMSTDDTRERLCGIHFDGATWVATDGHRLHRCDGMPVLFETARTVPSWAIAVLLRAIKWTRAESITVSESATRPDAAFTVGGAFGSVTVTTLAIDAQFPDYRQVTPDGDGWSAVECDADALRAAFKVAPIVLDGGLSGAIAKKRNLAFTSEGAVHAMSKDGAQTDLPLSGYVKEACALWFAAPYIDDALDGAEGAVVVKVDGYLSPMLVTHGSRLALVMPMRG